MPMYAIRVILSHLGWLDFLINFYISSERRYRLLREPSVRLINNVRQLILLGRAYRRQNMMLARSFASSQDLVSTIRFLLDTLQGRRPHVPIDSDGLANATSPTPGSVRTLQPSLRSLLRRRQRLVRSARLRKNEMLGMIVPIIPDRQASAVRVRGCNGRGIRKQRGTRVGLALFLFVNNTVIGFRLGYLNE